MHLYEIPDEIERICAREVDPETGEVTEDGWAMLGELEAERAEVALHLAAYLKGELAEAEAIDAEATRLKRRAEIHRNRANGFKSYLARNLDPGVKLEDARSKLSWRKSTAVEIYDTNAVIEAHNAGKIPDDCVETRVTIHVSKKAVKAALESGVDVPTAQVVVRQNLQVT